VTDAYYEAGADEALYPDMQPLPENTGEQYIEQYEEPESDGGLADRIAALEAYAQQQAEYAAEQQEYSEQAQYAVPQGPSDDVQEAEWSRQISVLEGRLGRKLLSSEWAGMSEAALHHAELGAGVDLGEALMEHHEANGAPDLNTRSGQDAYWAQRARDIQSDGQHVTQAQINAALEKTESENDLVRNQGIAQIQAWRLQGLVEYE